MINLRVLEEVFKFSNGQEIEWVKIHEEFGHPEWDYDDGKKMFNLCKKYNIEPKCHIHNDKLFIGYFWNKYKFTKDYKICCDQYNFTPDDLVLKHQRSYNLIEVLEIFCSPYYDKSVAGKIIYDATNSEEILSQIDNVSNCQEFLVRLRNYCHHYRRNYYDNNRD